MAELDNLLRVLLVEECKLDYTISHLPFYVDVVPISSSRRMCVATVVRPSRF